MKTSELTVGVRSTLTKGKANFGLIFIGMASSEEAAWKELIETTVTLLDPKVCTCLDVG